MAKLKLVQQNTDKLIDEFISQSENHPDLSLRAFYSTTAEFYKTNSAFRKTLNTILNKRKDITIRHFVNLMYRAFQYILLFELSTEGISSYKKEDWNTHLRNLIESEAYLQTYQDLLEKESTQTTIYQRYAGPKAVINSLFINKPVNVADLGCGLNLGLPGLELDHPFQLIDDKTADQSLSSLIRKPVKIKNGVSLDIMNPVAKKNWALACGFYPSELKDLPETDKLCDYLWSKTNTKFYEESILNVSKLWKEKKLPKVDVAIASTVLYQLSEDDQTKAYSEILKILKPGGILIVNDFVKVNHKISFVDWFQKGSSSYKTVLLVKETNSFSQPLEFISWNSGRCKVAESGKDFKKVLEYKSR